MELTPLQKHTRKCLSNLTEIGWNVKAQKGVMGNPSQQQN